MKNILIVDDDPFITALYHDKFAAAGFAVDVATNGRRAVQLLDERPPDVMLLDLSLGDMTGVKVLEMARAHTSTRTIPVVVLSNAYLGNLLAAARRAGASRCLNKGLCSPDRVVQEVDEVIAGTGSPQLPSLSYRPAQVPVPLPEPAPSARAFLSLPGLGAQDDEHIQAKLQRQLFKGMNNRMSEARLAFQRCQAEPAELWATLPKLRQTIHLVADSATLTGHARLSQLARALEAFLREIELDAPKAGAAVLRTIAQATDLMAVFLRRPAALPAEVIDSPSILVVDDDPISRAAVGNSLETARLRAISVGDPRQAVALFAENAFDLVFLDVDMPEMDGFAVCDHLHASRSNAKTPVVFVTAMKDLETCSRASRSGAVDFINKPLVFAEFALKALIHLDRRRLPAAS